MSACGSVDVAMRSRSRTVARRRRTLPASETAIAAGWAASSSATRRTAGNPRARSCRGSAVSPTPASSAFRIFCSLRSPMPESSRSRPSSAAVFRAVERRHAELGPEAGGGLRPDTGQAEEVDDAFRHALAPPRERLHLADVHHLDDLLLDRAADPREILGLPLEGELGDRHRRLADPAGGAPIRDDLEGLLVQDLREVGQQVELVGQLRVPGQRLRHPAMIRRCLAPSSAFPRTTSERTSSR